MTLPEKEAGALPLSGGDGVVERNLSLRPVATTRSSLAAAEAAAEACGGESPLLLALPPHEKAPLLLLLLWLLCQAANSAMATEFGLESCNQHCFE